MLKGSSFIFAADWCGQSDLPSTRVDFLAVRSYGEGTESTGVVQIVNDLSKPIEEEDVILVEDIVDTGLTINYLLDLLQTRKPKSLKVCSLLHKPARSKVAVPIDYLGFTIEDRFVIGYGLDFAEKYRGLPYIGVIHGRIDIGCRLAPPHCRALPERSPRGRAAIDVPTYLLREGARSGRPAPRFAATLRRGWVGRVRGSGAYK